MQLDPISKCLGIQSKLSPEKIISVLNELVWSCLLQSSGREDLLSYISSTLKRVETIVKTGKDPEPIQKIFPNIDSKAPPIVIKPVETGRETLSSTEYYFASSPVRTLLSDHHKPLASYKEEKTKKLYKTKTGKRKTPMLVNKHSESSRKTMVDNNSTYDGCMACSKYYEDGDNMIQCDGVCKGWYHIECANLSYKKFKRIPPEQEWVCEYCLNGLKPQSIWKGNKKFKSKCNYNFQ